MMRAVPARRRRAASDAAICSRREAIAGLGAIIGAAAASPLRAMQPAHTDEAAVWIDASTLAARIRTREISCVNLTELYLGRIERLNPTLGAYVTVTAARARADAARIDRAIARGQRIGPLAGVPIAHKDLLETAGIRTTAGSRLYEKHIPSADAAIVSALSAAGTVLLGKTNTHELGGGVTTINPFFGTTHNPWDVTRIPGGSSGGSAAAVVAGLSAAATGSDTGGSVRIPAALCGCVGFKPSFGGLPTQGLLGSCPTFDHVGLITRTVADAYLFYRSLGARAAAAPPLAIANLRIGVARNFFFEALQPAVAKAVADAIAIFGEQKAAVRDITFPIDAGTMARIFDPIVVSEIQRHFAREWKAQPDAFSPAFAAVFRAPTPTDAEVADARRALAAYQRAVEDCFRTVDVIVTPTVPVTAPRIDGPVDGELILRNTWPFNAARTPAISVPCGGDASSLPIGLQLAAAVGDEARLFGAAAALEAVAKWHTRRPELNIARHGVASLRIPSRGHDIHRNVLQLCGLGGSQLT